MFRIYTDFFPRSTLVNYSPSQHTETIIFSKNGKYIIYKDELYKNKLVNITSFEKQMGSYILYINEYQWKKEKTHHIPFDYLGMRDITFIEYIIDAKVKFIIEEINKKMVDFYFESYELSDNVCDQIVSFLSSIK